MFSYSHRLLSACLLGLAALTACAPVYNAGRKIGIHSNDSLKAAEKDFEESKLEATKVVTESSGKAKEIVAAGRALQNGTATLEGSSMPELVQNFSTTIGELKSKKTEFESQVTSFEEELQKAFERWQPIIATITDEELARSQTREFQQLQVQRLAKVRKAKDALAGIDAALRHAQNVEALGKSTRMAADIRSVLNAVDRNTESIVVAAANYNAKANEVLALLSPSVRSVKS